MIKVYIIGLCVLVIAIVVNVIVGKLGISTWYDFGTIFYQKGFEAMKEVGFISCLWLFVFYPLFLGLGYVIGLKIYELL